MVVSAGLGALLALLTCVGIPLLPCLLLLHQRGHLDSPGCEEAAGLPLLQLQVTAS